MARASFLARSSSACSGRLITVGMRMATIMARAANTTISSISVRPPRARFIRISAQPAPPARLSQQEDEVITLDRGRAGGGLVELVLPGEDDPGPLGRDGARRPEPADIDDVWVVELVRRIIAQVRPLPALLQRRHRGIRVGPARVRDEGKRKGLAVRRRRTVESRPRGWREISD